MNTSFNLRAGQSQPGNFERKESIDGFKPD